MERKRDKEETGDQEEGTKKAKIINVALCKELLWAAERGDTGKVMELLQSEGVDARYALEKDFFGDRTSLRLACVRGHLETARVLLEHGGETQEDLEWFFVHAAAQGHAGLVALSLEKGVDPALGNNMAFGEAAENGHRDVVELLLRDPRVDPSDQSICMTSSSEVVKLLLQDHRVDPATAENFAVREAARIGDEWHLEVLKLLLADPRVDGTCAIEEAHFRALPALLEDERCGIHWNRALFEEYHGREVLLYEQLKQERTARISAASWAMKQIGRGWGDLREPSEERMGALCVFEDYYFLREN